MDDLALIPCSGMEFFSSPPRLDRPWDPFSLLSNGDRGGESFPGGEAAGAWGYAFDPP
jgi:hypothetical protein